LLKNIYQQKKELKIIRKHAWKKEAKQKVYVLIYILCQLSVNFLQKEKLNYFYKYGCIT